MKSKDRKGAGSIRLEGTDEAGEKVNDRVGNVEKGLKMDGGRPHTTHLPKNSETQFRPTTTGARGNKAIPTVKKAGKKEFTATSKA